MRNALLFVLVLITGFGASADVHGCLGGWFEFTCNFKNNDKQPSVHTPRGTLKNISTKNENTWKLDNTTSLYHKTTDKNLTVSVQQLTNNDFDDYECKWEPKKKKKEKEKEKEIEIKLKKGKHCPQPSKLHVNRGAKLTINCTITCSEHEVNFICKNNTFTCDKKSSGRNYTISHVLAVNQGVYLCGCESLNPYYRVSREKIHLVLVKSPTAPPKMNTANPHITTTKSPHSTDGWRNIVIVMVVCIIILLLALAFCLHKKWCTFTKPVASLKEKEHCYDEIQERPQQLSSGTVLNTVYATATLDHMKPGPHSTGHSADAVFKDNVLYVQY
ncbi:uncharacterized protein LOC110163461 isoform X2 [Boleophthalmus pectinirostris]|uniref:uncharacterized protein LOC110163461 isoform X2 n=1 Tax=Boleophthalmus pectinirostris TaxID=150288 RepID=UPI00242E148F|nr:uncharacterized protein LOC110163461 isoform X2 [Boleophthalmus pectinirostris]